MNNPINEKNYPIRKLWLLKSLSGFLPLFFLMIVLLFMDYWRRKTGLNGETNFRNDGLIFYAVLFIGFATFQLLVRILQRINFHYTAEEKFFTLKQGIISKQERHIPFGVIQNIFLKQDLFDRIFGLASLTVENAAQGAGYHFGYQKQQRFFGLPVSRNRDREGMEVAGFYGNEVSIPGLAKKDAETLKEILLQKIKENPVEDNQSGL